MHVDQLGCPIAVGDTICYVNQDDLVFGIVGELLSQGRVEVVYAMGFDHFYCHSLIVAKGILVW